jgi:flagellar basal-body rod modification protein FlgD
MEITQSTAGLTTPTATPDDNATSKAAISSDFETFLKMLTVQMQNQDALNPIESSDYAVQLATFSGVEQQVRTNDLLKSLGGQMGLMGMSQLAGWVGMEARAAVPAQFNGDPITVVPKIAATADEAFLVVKNQIGAEVQRVSISAADKSIEWSGIGEDGNPMLLGSYSFHVENRSDGQIISQEQAEVYATVTEARNEAGQVMLVLQGGAEVSAEQITALRNSG